jgi:hypothetical protein
LVQDGSGYLYFTREGTVVMNLRTKEKITVSDDTTFTLIDAAMVVDTADEGNTGSLSAIAPANNTTLTVKNQSFSDLLQVQWQGVGFASNAVEDAVPAGNTVTKTVNPGSGYIYFKRKLTPVFARTQEVVTVTGGTEFVFTDTTLIAEVNNPANTGTLKDMPTTVVFFDDAEGELQGYAERKGSAYYAVSSDLPVYSTNSNYNFFHPPYTGTGKSIALGGYDDAKLRLSLTLGRKAKLSFRYANKDYNTNGGVLFIDGTEEAAWKGDYNWSYQEYTLEAGSHDIIWTKDGYYSGCYSYLSLDDILVVYIE